MKNNLDFYQHFVEADEHPKFKMLRVKFGWAGEGKFWALNNKIAQADNCWLGIGKKYNRATIADDLDFNIEEFNDFISYLRDECELIVENEEGAITTEIVQENLAIVMGNREKARERKQRRIEKEAKCGSGEQIESSGEQNNKVKESKVKESKVNKKKTRLPTDYPLSERHIEYALGKKYPQTAIPDLFEGFCLHHRQNGNTKIDWYLAWCTWVRNDIKWNGLPEQKPEGWDI
jgi:hypothetical protein